MAEKCPPPGKPVTFYKCHPDDHAPAPSVRADLVSFVKWSLSSSSFRFARLVEFLGASGIQILDSLDINSLLPGIGVKSHIALTWDASNLSRAMFSRHETLLAVCLSYVNRNSGQVVPVCLAAPSLGAHHDGKSMVQLVLRTLSDHPVGLEPDELRGRLACVGGDGAVTAGGPAAKHSSTRSCELLWEEVKGSDVEPMSVWGLFHRADRAQNATAQKCPMINEMLEVASECNRLFGVNAGRVLLRGVAAEMGEKALSVDQLSGTRKLASLEGAPAHLYRNYKLYFSGLAVRMLQSERGIGSQTKQSLTQVGRRLSSGTFVVFMLCFEDSLWLGQGKAN